MIEQQSTRRATAWRGPVARIVAGAAALTVGLIAWLHPFLAGGATWQWRITSEQDLAQAEVNAGRWRADATGVTMMRTGRRPVSVISPPLAIGATNHRLFAIDAAVPEAKDASGIESTVRLLWQDQPDAGFHFVEAATRLKRESSIIEIAVPVPASTLHRIGVQFPELDGPVRVASIELPNVPPGRRWRAAAASLIAPRPLRNHNVNFIEGPQPLGRGLNRYLAGLIAIGVGVVLLMSVRRGTGWAQNAMPAIVAIVAIAWLVGDLLATTSLARVTVADVRAFADKTQSERVVLADGDDIAWAFDQLRNYCAPGDTYAVVSDDPFTPSHRLDFLLAPERRQVEEYQHADRILVIHAAEAGFDAGRGEFQWRDGPTVAARGLARKAPRVRLLTRLRP
jgi:hypothetical protein